MELIPADLRQALLANAARAQVEPNYDPEPLIKLFTPDMGATWLLTHADEEDADLILWGLCDLGVGCPELGPVSLSELCQLRGLYGLPVERDLYFKARHSIGRYAADAYAAGAILA